MANTIELAKKYVPLLDEVYKVSAKSSVLDAPEAMVREGAKANQILIPSIALQGLADYDRSNGFVTGDVDFEWEPHTFTQDRGRSFLIDAEDNNETIDMAFAATTGQFVRTKVVPEVDAYRFATLSNAAITAGNTAAAVLTNATALQAIDTAREALADNEVDEASLVLFISPKVRTFLKQSNLITRQYMTQVGQTAVNREVDVLDGVPIVMVPQNRFYTEIDILGGGVGEEAGGYGKAVAGKDINFLLVDSNAVLGITKTALPRIFDPMTTQSANAWKFDYRLYHDLFVPQNKVNGVYVHTVA